MMNSTSPLKPTTSIQIGTWRQFEVIFRPDDDNDSISFSNAIRWLKPSSWTVLYHSFKELKLALSGASLQQWDTPSPHVFPALHFACSALNVGQAWRFEIHELSYLAICP
jgi:hypothetical protein